MKELFKKAYNQSFLLSNTVISFLSVLFFSSFSAAKNFKKNKSNIDTDCFLLGNGYSLKKIFEQNNDFFVGKEIIVVNLFFETIFFTNIKPNKYLIADEAFWKKTSDERLMRIQRSFHENMLKVNWKMNLFVPNDGYQCILDLLSSNSKITLISYNRTPVSGFKSISYFLYKRNLGMPRPSNVLNAAIFVALNMGYKKVYLYGADHSWLKDLFIDEQNNLCCYQNHFYDDNVEILKMPKGSLSDGLMGIVGAFDSYKKLNEYAKQLDSRVINKTNGSYIDIFDHE